MESREDSEELGRLSSSVLVASINDPSSDNAATHRRGGDAELAKYDWDLSPSFDERPFDEPLETELNATVTVVPAMSCDKKKQQSAAFPTSTSCSQEEKSLIHIAHRYPSKLPPPSPRIIRKLDTTEKIENFSMAGEEIPFDETCRGAKRSISLDSPRDQPPLSQEKTRQAFEVEPLRHLKTEKESIHLSPVDKDDILNTIESFPSLEERTSSHSTVQTSNRMFTITLKQSSLEDSAVENYLPTRQEMSSFWNTQLQHSMSSEDGFEQMNHDVASNGRIVTTQETTIANVTTLQIGTERAQSKDEDSIVDKESSGSAGNESLVNVNVAPLAIEKNEEPFAKAEPDITEGIETDFSNTKITAKYLPKKNHVEENEPSTNLAHEEDVTGVDPSQGGAVFCSFFESIATTDSIGKEDVPESSMSSKSSEISNSSTDPLGHERDNAEIITPNQHPCEGQSLSEIENKDEGSMILTNTKEELVIDACQENDIVEMTLSPKQEESPEEFSSSSSILGASDDAGSVTQIDSETNADINGSMPQQSYGISDVVNIAGKLQKIDSQSSKESDANDEMVAEMDELYQSTLDILQPSVDEYEYDQEPEITESFSSRISTEADDDDDGDEEGEKYAEANTAKALEKIEEVQDEETYEEEEQPEEASLCEDKDSEITEESLDEYYSKEKAKLKDHFDEHILRLKETYSSLQNRESTSEDSSASSVSEPSDDVEVIDTSETTSSQSRVEAIAARADEADDDSSRGSSASTSTRNSNASWDDGSYILNVEPNCADTTIDEPPLSPKVEETTPGKVEPTMMDILSIQSSSSQESNGLPSVDRSESEISDEAEGEFTEDDGSMIEYTGGEPGIIKPVEVDDARSVKSNGSRSIGRRVSFKLTPEEFGESDNELELLVANGSFPHQTLLDDCVGVLCFQNPLFSPCLDDPM